MDPGGDTTPVPCLNCNRTVNVPSAQVRMALREEREYIVFCTRKCNTVYVAREGAKQQEENARARHSDAHLGG